MIDYDGAIQVIIDPREDKPAVYRLELLPQFASAMCEGCGADRAEWVDGPDDRPNKDTPFYVAYALHAVDGFGDATTWCQSCTEGVAQDTTTDDGVQQTWYSGNYGDPHNWNQF